MNPANNLTNRNYQFQRSANGVRDTHHFTLQNDLSFNDLVNRVNQLFNGISLQTHSISMKIPGSQILLNCQASLSAALARLQPEDARIFNVITIHVPQRAALPQYPLTTPTDDQLYTWGSGLGVITRITGLHDAGLIQRTKDQFIHSEHMNTLRRIYQASVTHYNSRAAAANIAPQINPAPQILPAQPKAHPAPRVKLEKKPREGTGT